MGPDTPQVSGPLERVGVRNLGEFSFEGVKVTSNDIYRCKILVSLYGLLALPSECADYHGSIEHQGDTIEMVQDAHKLVIGNRITLPVSPNAGMDDILEIAEKFKKELESRHPFPWKYFAAHVLFGSDSVDLIYGIES